MKKFLSRKFILALVAGVVVVLNKSFDLKLDSDSILALAGIVITYVTTQGYVDSREPRSF